MSYLDKKELNDMVVHALLLLVLIDAMYQQKCFYQLLFKIQIIQLLAPEQF
jgi:hypothetical protein